MKVFRKIFLPMIVVGTLPFPSPLLADEAIEQFNEAMRPILSEYLKIGAALATDKSDGISAVAKRIIELSGTLDASGIAIQHAGHYNSIAKDLRVAAQALSEAEDITEARKDFAELSKSMVLWAGHLDLEQAPVNVMYCSMYPGNWLQEGGEIRNPYFGQKMPTCGKIIGGPDAGHEGDHHKGGHTEAGQ